MSIITDSRGIKYREVNGTFYHAETPQGVIDALERAMANDWRVTVNYGNVSTGESWEEEYDITGYIGRSTGSIKIPLLVFNKRSMGGGALLDDCILEIHHANKRDGGLIYQSPERKQYIYDQTHFTEGISI